MLAGPALTGEFNLVQANGTMQVNVPSNITAGVYQIICQYLSHFCIYSSVVDHDLFAQCLETLRISVHRSIFAPRWGMAMEITWTVERKSDLTRRYGMQGLN